VLTKPFSGWGFRWVDRTAQGPVILADVAFPTQLGQNTQGMPSEAVCVADTQFSKYVPPTKMRDPFRPCHSRNLLAKMTNGATGT
jgi:hypothetical protein